MVTNQAENPQQALARWQKDPRAFYREGAMAVQQARVEGKSSDTVVALRPSRASVSSRKPTPVPAA